MDDNEALAAAGLAERKKEQTIFDMFETDESVETTGVLLRYCKKIRILVARAGGANKRFETIIKNLTKPHRNAIRNGTLDDDVMLEILQDAYARSVVLGWEGVTEKDGTEIACTPANVKDLFKRIPALWIDVQNFASNYANYLVVEEDTDTVVKN